MQQGFIQLSEVIRLNGRYHFSTRLDSAFLYMFYATRLNRTPNYDPWDQIRASRRAQYAWMKA